MKGRKKKGVGVMEAIRALFVIFFIVPVLLVIGMLAFPFLTMCYLLGMDKELNEFSGKLEVKTKAAVKWFVEDDHNIK